MLSPRAIYGEIFRNDEAFRLLLLHRGKQQEPGWLGGWEAGARRTSPHWCLSPSVTSRPRSPGTGPTRRSTGASSMRCCASGSFRPVPVPADIDYTMRLERLGIGLARSKLRAAGRWPRRTSWSTWRRAG